MRDREEIFPFTPRPLPAAADNAIDDGQAMSAHPFPAVNRIGKSAAPLGRPLFLIACIGLGLVELLSGKALAQLHPWGAASSAMVSGASLTVLGLWLLLRPSSRIAAFGLAAHWTLALAFTLLAAAKGPSSALNWVPVSQAALFVLASLASSNRPGLIHAQLTDLRLPFAGTLIFYGLVHIFHRDLIAGLIPVWIPGTQIWPWITGSIMIAAGAALVTGRAVELASLAIAAMFASWILLVHLGRLAGDPASGFEWGFALTALALTGVALLAMKRRTPPMSVEPNGK